MNAFPCFIRVRLLIAHCAFPPPLQYLPHLQIPLLSRIMKQDYIGVVGRAA